MNIPHFGLKRQYKNLKDELLDATDHALRDGCLVGGLHTKKFEEWLARKTSTRYAITVHSGTQALEIIAKFYKEHISRVLLSPTVKLPNLTYPATLNAFLSAGYTVELVDTDKYGIINQVPYSVMCLVGLYGRKPWPACELQQSVIVDGAQHWLVANGEVGLGMAISFDPTKNLPSSGNGGAIVTNNEQLYMYASAYRDHNKPYFHSAGSNTKMSEQDCAQTLVRAKYIDQWQLRRQEISEFWCEEFRDLPLECLNDTRFPHAYQKFVMYISDRNSMHTHLLTDGIESKIHYEYVLGDLPTSKDLVKPDLLSTSVMLSRGVLSLPLYPELGDSEVEYIRDKVCEFYKQ